MIRFISVVLLSFGMTATAASVLSPKMKVVELGNPKAETKGTFYFVETGEPQNLSPMNSSELVSTDIYSYVMQGLLRLNPDTLKFEPELADKYTVSKDYLTYTFYLDKDAKFSDGTPVTADDVKFSVDCVKDPAYQAAARMPYYDNVKEVKVIDPHTVQFIMKRKYFKTLEVIATAGFTPILPKHIYGNPKKDLGRSPIFGSGPYKVQDYHPGNELILVSDPNFWGAKKPGMRSFGKWKRIVFKFVKDENLAISMARNLQVDYMRYIRIENFVKIAVGAPFGTKVKKMKVSNMRPKDYGFIGWNEKNPLFQDRDVRVALSHLFNRKLLIKKFMYGMAVEGVGPVYYKSPFMPKNAKPIEYDPSAARKLLKKAGWADSNHDGVLDKVINGQRRDFRFTLLLPSESRDSEKYFTMYQEDLKKAGIQMDIKLVEWSTFDKLLEEQKFEAVTLSWGGGSVEDDLKQIWHSDSARMGGSNFISYKNKSVDKYIDEARVEMNPKKRKALWQKAVRQIIDDAPYTYMFNLKYDIYLLNSRVGYDKPTYNYDFSTMYWYPL